MVFSQFCTLEANKCTCRRFQALIFYTTGRFGIQVVFCPFNPAKTIVNGFIKDFYNVKGPDRKLWKCFSKFEVILLLFLLREMTFLWGKTTLGKEVYFSGWAKATLL